ncbi:MAG: hypothetical protein QM679_09650 [Patulibacter sp.]
MPTFCRHGRFEASCAICRQEQTKAAPKAVTPRTKGGASRRPASSASAPVGSRTGAARTRGVVTGKLQRAADDGYRSDLLPGVRSTADVLQLAEQLVLAETRLAAYGGAQAGPWAAVAALAGEPHRAFIVALVTALASPDSLAGSIATAAAAQEALEGGGDAAARGELAAIDELAALLAAGPRGPRAHDATAAALAVPAQLAQRSEGGLESALTGDASWSSERRFARLFDRLALRGLPRAVRFDLLTALGRCGALPLRADALHLGSDQVTDAAKRYFAVADVALLERRAAALVEATGVSIDALELALWNIAGADAGAGGAAARWSTAKPVTDLGLPGEADDDQTQTLAELLR